MAIHQARENIALLSRLSSEARRLAEEREDAQQVTLVEMYRAYGEYKAQQKKAETAAARLPPCELEQASEGLGDGTERMPNER